MSEKARMNPGIRASLSYTAASLVLTGCVSAFSAPQHPTGQDTRIYLGDGTIWHEDRPFIRTQPVRDDTGETQNHCSRLTMPVSFESTDAWKSVEDPQNGPWIGFKLEVLPETIQLACADDPNGIVWVQQDFVHADGVYPDQGMSGS